MGIFYYFQQVTLIVEGVKKKSLSSLRGFYWYLTIIKEGVSSSLQLGVHHITGNILPYLFLAITDKRRHIQIVTKGNYGSRSFSI